MSGVTAAAAAHADLLCTNDEAMGESEAGRDALLELQAAGAGLAELLGWEPTPAAAEATATVGAIDGAASAANLRHPTRVLACCAANAHALVDVALPLGEQALGIALFPSLSFFNHACAPTAALSTRPAPERCAVSGAVRATTAVGCGLSLIHISEPTRPY